MLTMGRKQEALCNVKFFGRLRSLILPIDRQSGTTRKRSEVRKPYDRR